MTFSCVINLHPFALVGQSCLRDQGAPSFVAVAPRNPLSARKLGGKCNGNSEEDGSHSSVSGVLQGGLVREASNIFE